MPTYEYECRSCGHRFDILQKITDDPLTVCPNCKRSKLKRLIGAGLGVIFKGSGFYTTDYKRSGSNGPAKKKGEGSESSSAESKSGDSKPAESKSKVETKTA